MTKSEKGMFDLCLKIATSAHFNQVDKNGLPYILHPLAVAERVANTSVGVMGACVALLHDVLEDSTISREELAIMGVDSDTLFSVNLLTRPGGMAYQEYINKIVISNNKMAVIVKYYDLCHNMKNYRASGMTNDRAKRYMAAKKKIEAAIDNIHDLM